MRKSIPALRQAEYESISDLPRIQQCYREKVFVVIPSVMRIRATSNGEQRVQVLIPVVQGLSEKQRQWDDATRDFWSRLSKALQQSSISVTWAEQLDISANRWKNVLGCSN